MQKIYKYITVGFILIILDRLTKIYAKNFFDKELVVNKFLSFELVYNKGISWGILNNDNVISGILVNSVTCAIICYLIVYAYNRFKQNKTILGETLVIAGALSNLTDRFIYKAVIDFIGFSINNIGLNNNWQFPYFNIADICIFFGVIFMFLNLNQETKN